MTRFNPKAWRFIHVLTLVLSTFCFSPVSAQSFPEIVTIGVFLPEGNGYKRLNRRDLVMEVGVPCFVWARQTQGTEQDPGKHLHYNAADKTDYFDGFFTWIEYGPEHSEQDIRRRCENKENPSRGKYVSMTEYFEDQQGDQDPYYLKLVNEGCPPLKHDCREVGEYKGVNAVPAVTMIVLPSNNGHSVTNDAEYPPGTGAKVVVGYWVHPKDYHPGQEVNPCKGEPAFKIAYPVDYGAESCYAWNHWVAKESSNTSLESSLRFDNHPNSAKEFSCNADRELNFTQTTTMTCRLDEPTTAHCRQKTASRTHCCRDNPPTLWSQTLSGCG